ncbi:hypothetical protein [Natronobacterium texcoconense]|uniref:Histidine kinase n=1 Tax=Natronobacterium texcoconense TaxID=1095778 RepID=A0A1H0ZED3_NATTX|nr:hypothetical protein [Natronobacterium texcoconense]SDQ25764.1 hypothetical protein SAMN04489842_0249 [Natronobacterium texcoconense]
MSNVDSPTEHGFGGTGNWLLGGALGGVVGSLLFGVVLWFVDSAIITEAIPAIYGVEPIGTAGWIFHLVHGLVLGIVFGIIVSRNLILGTLMADVETGFIAAMGPGVRFALAGMVYGLAVWAILPLLVLPIWMSIGGIEDPGFPMLAFETLVGHLLYGLLLGALFSVFVESSQKAEEAEAPFEEATDTPQE